MKPVSAARAIVSLACALAPLAQAVSPVVDLGYSKYQGTALPNGISQWLGIRYAAPPLGELRFMPPQDPPSTSTLQIADEHGKICLATADSPTVNTTSEDCLFLDVYAPSNATVGSKLPLFFFIQGGGFNSDSNANYNGSGLVAASGYNIVVVTFNYRVGPYGFLTDGGGLVTANNGLRDQRKALQWVQAHAASFGGDPGHVVLGGDSAGAASISLHLAATGANGSVDNTGLFHAAAAESVSFATVLTAAQAQYQFEDLAIRAGCAAAAPAASLACLRNRTATELQAVNMNEPYAGAIAPPLYMYGPVIDGDFITDYTYAAFATGNFIRVPLIVGDDTNGGTIFTPKTTATIGQSDAFLRDQFPYLTLGMLARMNALYPNPNASFPGCTGEPGCYWRQVSNAYGEMRYMCPGLYISAAAAAAADPNSCGGPGTSSKSWAYRWNVEDPAQVAQGLGVPHTVEVNAIFGPENTNGGAPASYYPGGVNSAAVAVVQAYWTSFIRAFDPNAHRLPGSAEWASWDNSTSRARLLFNTSGVTVMEPIDDALGGRCAYLESIGLELRQ